jgi:eukaryotic-like serine/threonine-protein kinase
MPALFCPVCRQTLPVGPDQAGQAVRCPGCDRTVTAQPVPSATHAVPPSGSAPTAAFPPSHAEEAPPGTFAFLRPPQGPDELGRLGGYRVLGLLGRGGMGVVFLAEDLKLGRRVALKVMRPDMIARPAARQRFLREARAAARLQHDHVVAVHQVDEDNGVPFLVMPLLRGETLAKRLARQPRLPIQDVLRIGREMAEGLAAAHAAGLIHRDVKPANVWVEEPGGRVKLLDFGLARDEDEQRTRLTSDGVVLGTPAYLAPEQAGGKADQRADLFSLGCVLYEMTTGRRAFRGDTVLSVLSAIAAGTPPGPRALRPETPAALSDLILALLSKRAEGRPPSARAVAERLRALERERPPAVGAGRTRRRAVLLAVLGVLLAVPVLALVLYAGRRADDNGRTNGKPPPDEPPGEKPPRRDELVNSVGMRFVRVPRGASWLDGGGGRPPQRPVEITYDLQMGACTVTQGQWQAVMGYNPSFYSRAGSGREQVKDIPDEELRDFPVEWVSWEDAQEFVRKLNERERAAGWTYRLPTYAEWEYACRGGAPSKEGCSFDFYFDRPTNALSSREANIDGDQPAGGAAKGPSLGRPAKVGSYPPNRLGLYDMHGNVWQWCEEPYGDGSTRAIRGGAWNGGAHPCRASGCSGYPPDGRAQTIGVRLVRVPAGP